MRPVLKVLDNNVKGEDGNSVLYLLVGHQNYSAVRQLLEDNADPNCFNEKMNTPLHLAMMKANIDIIRLLIEYGA